MDCPLDYSFCDRTATWYAFREGKVLRRVLDRCFLQVQTKEFESTLSPSQERAFVLIVPGAVALQPGDRVLEGIGPVVDGQQWERFIPANIPGLCQVQFVQQYHWNGQVCHTEAGRKASNFLF